MSALAKAYARCRRLEAERERKRLRYSKGKFAASMLHIEVHADFQDIENSDRDPRNAWISDKGVGAEDVRSFEKRKDGSYYTRRIKIARVRLSRVHPELVEVFNLVAKNGKNRSESIAELVGRGRSHDAARVLYWKHLKKISLFFKAQ